jgi:hypothetical protein
VPNCLDDRVDDKSIASHGIVDVRSMLSARSIAYVVECNLRKRRQKDPNRAVGVFCHIVSCRSLYHSIHM